MRKGGVSDIVNRYESKYLVPIELLPEVRRFIRPFVKRDSNGVGLYPEYTITTLQMDTPSLALHHAKEWEVLDRFKLRVRTYGEIGVNPIYAEIKAKYRDTIVKHRAQIPFDLWGRDLVMEPFLPNIFVNEKQEIDFLRFKMVAQEIGAIPVMLVRYRRESYVGTLDHYLRVTFDTHLEYQMTNSWTDFGRTGLWRNMDSGDAQNRERSCVVMELKTLDETPMWIMHMVEKFQLVKGGNCKYSTGLWREGLFRQIPDGRENEMVSLAIS